MEKWKKYISDRKRKRETEKDEDDEDDDEELYVPLKKRKKMETDELKEFLSKKSGITVGEDEDNAVFGPKAKVSLFKRVSQLRELQPKKTLVEREVEKEKKMLENVSIRKALIPVNIVGTDMRPIQGIGWSPPKYIRKMRKKERDEIIKKYKILVEGNSIPNPILKFEDMKLPKELITYLNSKNIKNPTPIQFQGIPMILSGRDIIGISYTGSGKTLAFVIPMLMVALLEEKKVKLILGEGPTCLVLVPNRELAKQIYGVVLDICKNVFRELRVMLCMGGTTFGDQERLFSQGFHICVATPGRLKHMLDSKVFTLDYCKYLVLDEADRMVDLSFEKAMREIFDFFTLQRQTVLFSATMPPKIQKFATSALINPLVVNVGRAGASSMNVRQEFVYVDPENKMYELLKCLQKTGPPVLIFSSDKMEVDDIYELLLLKNIKVSAIHGSKEQSERNHAIETFTNGEKDVLVATGIASKGLDFPDIKHVINYDMPKVIENYVHQIGRTGRFKSKGLSTTMLNFRQVDINLIFDLKLLLVEAKQDLPDFLKDLKKPIGENETEGGCSYCGGLGHKITNCKKLGRDSKRNVNQFKLDMDRKGF